MRSALTVMLLVALLAAGAGVHTSRAAFTAAKVGNPASFTTATDWVPPAVTLTAPADRAYTKSATPTLSGAAGNATGDSATVTASVYSGTAATGTAVQTRTATRSAATWSTTATTLADATYTVRATQTDTSGNTGGSATSTFTVDTKAPTPVMISAANPATGGAKGRLGAGDSITYTFSEPIAAASVLSTFAGGSATADVRVRFTNAASADTFTVLDSAAAANVKLDTSVATNANLVTGTVTWPATMTQSSDGASFTIVLGTAPTSGLATTANTAKNMVWTANAAPTDRAGNPLTIAGTIPETDNDIDF